MVLPQIQYITNNQGIQTSVVIPINVWKKISDDYDILKKEISYIEHLQKEIKKLSEQEIVNRALLAEKQIAAKQYTGIDELETEMKNW